MAKLNDMPDITSTFSAYECTGLMPRRPVNDAELEAYQELFGMEIPKHKD